MKLLAVLLIIFAGFTAACAEPCEIVYGMRSDPYKPYEWQDKSKGPQGMNIELLKLIGAQTGCSYRIVIGNRVELLEMLKNGEITMLSMSPSAKVDQFAVYIQQSIVLNRYVVNRQEDPYVETIEDWHGKTILCVSDTYTESYLESIAQEYNLSMSIYNSHDEMSQALMAGVGDFMITSLPVIMNLPESYHVKINGYPIIPTVYGFTLHKSNIRMYTKINSAMEELKSSGKYFDILKKWSRPLETPAWHNYILPTVTAVIIIITAILLWNKSLHLRVQQKTASLNNLTQLLQMLLDVLPEQIYLINREGSPVWSNAVSQNTPFSIDLIKNEIEQAIAINSSFEIKRLLDNAETWAVSGIILEKGEEPLLLVASNITETVRQKDESLTADRMAALGNMAANIAHEINNPAGLIMHNINFLQQLSSDLYFYMNTLRSKKNFAGFLWDEAQKEGFAAHKTIAENIRRIINTVEDLKKFSKKRDDVYNIVDLRTCLNNSIRFVNYFVKSYTSKFQCQVTEPIPMIFGHEQHIEQIIINLIQNACYALTNKSQAIRCRLASSGDGKYVSLTVEDEGRGMDEATRKKAFTAFFTTRESGTGLGLSIVASIVKEHKGYYTLESEPGKGTRISIFFPKEGR